MDLLFKVVDESRRQAAWFWGQIGVTRQDEKVTVASPSASKEVEWVYWEAMEEDAFILLLLMY